MKNLRNNNNYKTDQEKKNNNNYKIDQEKKNNNSKSKVQNSSKKRF